MADTLKHPTLFSRDTTGKVRVWFMESAGSQYRTTAGIMDVDSSMVTSAWSVAKAKNVGRANATTAEEQALKEVKSRYTKQLKTGYFERECNIDEVQYVEPMLAENFKKYRNKIDLTSGKFILQTKYNGLRMVATKDGLFTRKGERYVSVPHIQNALAPFFAKYPNAVLDGECFNEEYRQQLNQINHLARKTKNVTKADLAASEEMIRFYVYDGYGFSSSLGENAKYTVRKAWIDANVVGFYDYVQHVTDYTFDNEDELMEIYSDFVADGHEGGILRNGDAPYEHKRSKNLLKLKPEDTEDFTIVDIQDGEGNWSGKAKIISVRAEDGRTFDATFKGNSADAVECLENKDFWIGKLVEIKFNGLTAYGIPNFAQFDYKNADKGDR